MAIYKLDENGKKIKPGERGRKPARDAMGRFHWHYQVSKSAKNPKELTRRFWATEEELPDAIKNIHTGNTGPVIDWHQGLKIWEQHHPKASASYKDQLDLNVKLLMKQIGNTSIANTTKEQMRNFLNTRFKVSGATANKARRLFSIARFLQTKLDMIEGNLAFLSIGTYPEKEAERKPIPTKNIDSYIDACPAPLRFIIEFIFYTGVRSTEACTLKEEDMSPQIITIMQKGKGQGKRRAEVISDKYIKKILDAAKAYKEEQEANSPYIFIRPGKKCFRPWNKDLLRKAWIKALEKANLKYYRIHEIRHTFATLAGEAGFSEKYLQAAMRWDDPTMAKRYVHESKSMARKVARKVRAKLSGEKLSVKVCPHCGKPINE